MRKTVLLALMFLVPALWAQAQSAKPSPDAGQASGKASDKASDLPTLTGCLQTSMGTYQLVEEDGTSNELSGGAKLLKHHVGHEIEVSGKPGTRTTSTTQAGGASTVVVHATFEVKSVKHVADKCQ